MSDAARPPRIAVLMSTYNGARYLREQLDSIQAQQGAEVQLFVRDDGSIDATLDILETYAPTWPQLVGLASGPNLGAARSFMALLRQAPDEFDYYAFADQDDVWAPDKLARAVSLIEGSGEHGPTLYCSRVTCVNEALLPLGEPAAFHDPSFRHLVFENIAYGCTIVMNANLRRVVVDQAATTGVAMHDWWCAITAAAFGTVVYDPEPRILYRQHGGNEVGTEPNPLLAAAAKLRALRRKPQAFYPIHAQCAAFLRLHGDALSPDKRMLLERVVRSKASLGARLAFALTAPVVRNRWTDNLAARGLFALGWY